MVSIKTKSPSRLTIYLKQVNETLAECSNAELGCVDAQPVESKNAPEIEQALKHQQELTLKHQQEKFLQDQQEYSLEHQQDYLLKCQQDQLLKHQGRSVNYQQEYLLKHKHQKVKSQRMDHIICNVCHKEFATKTQRKSHMLQHIKGLKGPFKCEKCTDFCYTKSILLKHYEIKHPSKRVITDEEFCEKSELTMKKRSTKRKPFTCPICQKGKKTKRHKLQKLCPIHKGKNFYCDVCHKVFTTTKSVFKIHMQQHIPENEAPFKCKLCPKQYEHKKNLIKHYRVEHSPAGAVREQQHIPVDKGLFKCENCPRYYAHKKNLMRHYTLMRNHLTTRVILEQPHTPDNIRKGPFKCEHCPKYYTHKGSLMRHYRLEHSPKGDFYDEEFCEKSKLTDLFASAKSESNETDSSIATVMYEEVIKKTVVNQKDKVLLESDIPVDDEGFSESELSEEEAPIKSEPSPESPYVNLEDDKFTVEDYILTESDMPVSDKEFCEN